VDLIIIEPLAQFELYRKHQWETEMIRISRAKLWMLLLSALILCRLGLDWRNIAISNNVGLCQALASTREHALMEERHFALSVGLRVSNLGSL
jgi:hypothetical protein